MKQSSLEKLRREFRNIAAAYNKMHALIQRDGKPEIDYPKVLLS
jgi:hypothetical protein